MRANDGQCKFTEQLLLSLRSGLVAPLNPGALCENVTPCDGHAMLLSLGASDIL